VITVALAPSMLAAYKRTAAASSPAEAAAADMPVDAAMTRPEWFDAWEQGIRRSAWRITSVTYTEPSSAAEPFLATFEVTRAGRDASIVLYDYPPSREADARGAPQAAAAFDHAGWNAGLRVAIAKADHNRKLASELLAAVTPE
jgi:hypothetical protein